MEAETKLPEGFYHPVTIEREGGSINWIKIGLNGYAIKMFIDEGDGEAEKKAFRFLETILSKHTKIITNE